MTHSIRMAAAVLGLTVAAVAQAQYPAPPAVCPPSPTAYPSAPYYYQVGGGLCPYQASQAMPAASYGVCVPSGNALGCPCDDMGIHTTAAQMIRLAHRLQRQGMNPQAEALIHAVVAIEPFNPAAQVALAMFNNYAAAGCVTGGCHGCAETCECRPAQASACGSCACAATCSTAVSCKCHKDEKCACADNCQCMPPAKDTCQRGRVVVIVVPGCPAPVCLRGGLPVCVPGCTDRPCCAACPTCVCNPVCSCPMACLPMPMPVGCACPVPCCPAACAAAPTICGHSLEDLAAACGTPACKRVKPVKSAADCAESCQAPTPCQSRQAPVVSISASDNRIHINTPDLAVECDRISRIGANGKILVEGDVNVEFHVADRPGAIHADCIGIGLRDASYVINPPATCPGTKVKQPKAPELMGVIMPWIPCGK